MQRVIIFSINGCKPCEALKEKLREEGIEFEERKIETIDELKKIEYREFPTVEIIDDGSKKILVGCNKKVIEEIKKTVLTA